jgi:hypothetical protein
MDLEGLEFIQTDPAQQLARVHFFSVMKREGDQEIEFTIKVRQYLKPREPGMTFLAEADKQTNQKSVPYTPMGWGVNMFQALTTCIREINRFPYQG